MDKTLIITVSIDILVTGLVLGLHSMSDIDPILEANVEALTRGEGSESITCEAPWDPVCTTLGNLVISGTRVR